MNEIKDLTIVELHQLLNVIEKMREKYDKEFTKYGLSVLQYDNDLNQAQQELLSKRKKYQERYEKIEKLIEDKILNGL